MTFTTSYKVNELGLIISPEELKALYFYGIPIVERFGTEMAEKTIETFIRSAQKQVEGFLNIKLQRQIIEERIPFDREAFMHYNYLQSSYPVRKAFRLQGWIANIKQVEYPVEWLTVRTTTDGETFHRRIHLIPVGSTEGQVLTFNGLQPYVGMRGRDGIPDYWKVAYSTGYDRIPEDILTVVGMYASILIFHQLGDIILGAGIANMSLGVDGLSQSIGTTSSATNAGYGARIIGYLNNLKVEMQRLHDKYTGFIFTSL
jgi:hypothetical protein